MDTSPTPAEFRFHAYRLLPAQRLLLDGTRPVKLGSRAFDMLQVLIERRERVVGKHELMDLVWPKLVVEENNLQVQVMALRKLLGHGAIATVPGRGYRFTLAVQTDEPAPVPAPPAGLAGAEGLPALVGRDEELRTLLGLIDEHPVVTVAGAGGIGKTRLAQSAAHACAPRRGDGVWWIELAGLSDPALVPIAVGQALGLQLDSQADANGAVARALEGKAALLVLDNAEHLLDAVAALVATLRERATSVKLLVTSQEVMRGLDEQVFRPGPLALPQGDDLAAVRASGAVALFVARAQQADPRFSLHEHNSAAVADICRRLDGIPLAIELAAARVPLLGVEGVRARLHDRFSLLTAGARAAMRRHQTLRAALDWSHGLLTAAEQVAFRRLGVFAGGFTLEAAQRVVSDEDIDAWDALEHLGALVDKSMVVAEGDPIPRYHLLETTRLFALERMAQAGETETMLRRHAQDALSIADLFAAESQAQAKDALIRLDRERDNLLHALAWCDRVQDVEAASIGQRLAAALRDYWPARGLIGTGLAATLRALARAEALPGDVSRCRALRSAARLLNWSGQNERATALSEESLSLAQDLGDPRSIASGHYYVGGMACEQGQLDKAQAHFEAMLPLARSVGSLTLEGNSLEGMIEVLALRGEHARADELRESLVELRRRDGGGSSLALALWRRATRALELGELDRAEVQLCEALPLVQCSGSLMLHWVYVGAVGAAAAQRSRWADAAHLYGAATQARDALAMVLDSDDLGTQSARHKAARAALGEAAFEALLAQGAALPIEEHLGLCAKYLVAQP